MTEHGEITEKTLIGRWLHSHEEDSAERQVYRPARSDFPPARGRLGFSFRADGTGSELGVAPIDGPQERELEWELDSDNVLTIRVAGNAGLRRLHVVKAESDMLVVEENT